MSDKKVKPPYWEMGQRIAKARTTLTDMNQPEMTDALGLKEPTYGNYERGTRRMPPHTMAKFQKLTGCSADYIYLGTGPMRDDQAQEDEFMSIMAQIDDPEMKAKLKDEALKLLLGKK